MFYKGAWTLLKKDKANKIIENGFTLDVTSLYPSAMHSIGGFRYPVGLPTPLYEMPKQFDEELYYFIHIRCSFELRKGYLPTIQIKGSPCYKGNEWLESSRIYYKGVYYDKVIIFGREYTKVVDLYLTQYDFKLLFEHYNFSDLEYVDGCVFFTKAGIFDEYIDKFIYEKNNSEGANRAIAKYFLNNLYGKIASSDRSSYKVAYINEEGAISYNVVEEHNKQVLHIACGAAITSHARYFTITHAQANYDIFCYADTDSLHMQGNPDNAKKCVIAKNQLNTWKLESIWTSAIFVRQKVYIERYNDEFAEDEKMRYLVKCAGMGKRCKQLIRKALGDEYIKVDKITDEEAEFLEKFNGMEDFKVGLKVPSNLKSKQIKGGTLLVKKDFNLR